MPSTNHVTIRRISRVAGEAGHVTYDVDVQTHDGSVHYFTFSGNIFVGPVMLSIRRHDGQWSRDVIDEPRRFGEFASEEWVNRYFEGRATAGAYASD